MGRRLTPSCFTPVVSDPCGVLVDVMGVDAREEDVEELGDKEERGGDRDVGDDKTWQDIPFPVMLLLLLLLMLLGAGVGGVIKAC